MDIVKLPRVTEILHPFAQYKGVAKDVLDNAATRGTKVHGLCAIIAKGLWLPPMTEELKPYVESFEDWHKSNVKQLYICEQRFHDLAQSYTGQIDYVFELEDGKNWLVDLKT